jgi:polygalacturonase
MRTLALSLNTYLARGLRSCIAARLHLLPSGLKGKKVMKISNIGNPALSLLLAVFGTCLVALVPPAMAQTTGDSRTVTEPVFPAVCSQLSAAITEVNNDIPTTVDATVTNPDGARIQAALNSCSTSHPGEAVELSMDPTGAYNAFLSGPLSMPSNVTLLVDPGVTLFFSRNAADYYKSGSTCGTVNSGSSTSSCKPLIDVPSGVTNVGIMGYGKMDGRGGDPLINAFTTAGHTAPGAYSWWTQAAQADISPTASQQNPIFVQLDGGSNITMYKITLLNSPMFHVKGNANTNGFTAWDVKIVTPTYTRNTDGIDPDQAQNWTVTKSWISDGDDNIAVGASGTPGGASMAKNISITNNHFFAGHGESIGSFTDAGVTNALFDGNMLAGDDFSGFGSAINATAFTMQSTPAKTYPVDYADGNSTAIRIKSDQAAGGIVTNIQYSNSCFLDHKSDLLFTPLYNTDSGSDTPNVSGVLLQNLAFLNDDKSAGTLQFTGTHTTVSGKTLTYPLGVTLSNVTFPSALSSSFFTNTGTSGTEMYANLTYGPGDVSANFISAYATFAGVPSNNDTVTNNITASSLNPPTCNFTYIAPELTGPAGRPQTIAYGQTATAVVILTPAVGGAAYPTGTVTLTDALTGNTTQATLPGNIDTIFVPLTGLGAGTHTFTAAYSGDSNYTLTNGQTVYSTAGPYNITVSPAPLTVTANNASRAVGAANPTFTASYSGFVNGDTAAVLSGSPALSSTATTSSPAGTYPITAAAGTLAAANYTFNFVNGTLSVVAPPTVELTTTATLSGSASAGYQATVTVTNSGSATASNVTLTAATLGSATGSPLPQTLPSIPAGQSGTFVVSFPGSAGANGAGVAEKYAGTYTGGSFSASIRSAILP